MPLNLVTTGNVVLAADINQLVQVLQRSAGQTETGTYYITGNGSNTASIGMWIASLSRNATPVSVTIDTSITAPSNCQTPATSNLSANGFHIYTALTSTTLAANVAGSYTIQY